MPKTISRCNIWRGKVEYKSLIPPRAGHEQISPNFLSADLSLSYALLLTVFLLLLRLHLELIWAAIRLLFFSTRLGTERHCHGSPRCSWWMG